jgi:hypothetical protein
MAMQVWDAYLHRPPVAPSGWIAPKGFGGWPSLQLQEFADYFEQYWFGKMPLLWWNHWHSQTDRTTNAAEAFHSVMSKFAVILLPLITL